MNTITVCVLTYKRIELLKICLRSLFLQSISDDVSFNIIVIDNDRSKSALETVNELKRETLIELNYFCVEEKNIAVARNKALEKAETEYIAFIDDDEFADKNWLENLYQVMKKNDVDVVNGPVCPCFPDNASKTLKKSGFFEEFRYKEASKNYHVKATGNCMIKRRFVLESEVSFDAAFGLTGGEDALFFSQLEMCGAKFYWTNQAKVYERILEHKLSYRWLLLRRFRYGNSFWRIKKKTNAHAFALVEFLPSLIFIFMVILILPFSLFYKQKTKKLFSFLGEIFFGLGKITSMFGYRFVEYG